jgi:hemerythrin-like metal-binding protein
MSAAGPGIELGHAQIDALHVEFDACVVALAHAPVGQLNGALLGLREHLLHHFGAEERWMRESGFPAIDCHKREHDKVLEVLSAVEQRFAGGDAEVVQRLAAELPNWFAIHAATMDAALAAWLGAGVAASAAT